MRFSKKKAESHFVEIFLNFVNGSVDRPLATNKFQAHGLSVLTFMYWKLIDRSTDGIFSLIDWHFCYRFYVRWIYVFDVYVIFKYVMLLISVHRIFVTHVQSQNVKFSYFPLSGCNIHACDRDKSASHLVRWCFRC